MPGPRGQRSGCRKHVRTHRSVAGHGIGVCQTGSDAQLVPASPRKIVGPKAERTPVVGDKQHSSWS